MGGLEAIEINDADSRRTLTFSTTTNQSSVSVKSSSDFRPAALLDFGRDDKTLLTSVSV
jgi:hypothetical protein